MLLRRALTAGLLSLAAVAVAPAAGAAAAAPAPYPPTISVSLSLSSSVIRVGTTISVSGSGFAANTTVSVTTARTGQGFARTEAAEAPLGRFRPAGTGAPAVRDFAATTALASVGTDGSGSFTTSLTFNQVGVFVVTASGVSADGRVGSATGTVTVLPLGGGGAGGPGSGAGSGSGSGTGSGNGGNGGNGGSASGVGGLPNTGASIGLPVTAGAILVLLGAALVTVVRRRKRGDATV